MPSDDDPDLHLLYPREHASLPMTPPEMEDDYVPATSHDVGRNLDLIVHRLNRKPLLHDSSLRTRFLGDHDDNADPVQSEPETIASPSEPLPTALPPIAEMPTRVLPRSCPVAEPVYHHMPPSSQPLMPSPPIQQPRPQRQLTDPSSHETSSATSFADPAKRLRRHTETRIHRSASNLRTLDAMVENGVQCNVQGSTPPSPTRTSSSTCSALPEAMDIEPQYVPHLSPPPSRLELEVDHGFSEQDEDTMLNETLALRHASTPTGIRKFGYLRYRSSTEAAMSCKNMKRSAPRMRRRNRPSISATAGNAAPSASASTSATSLIS